MGRGGGEWGGGGGGNLFLPVYIVFACQQLCRPRIRSMDCKQLCWGYTVVGFVFSLVPLFDLIMHTSILKPVLYMSRLTLVIYRFSEFAWSYRHLTVRILYLELGKIHEVYL